MPIYAWRRTAASTHALPAGHPYGILSSVGTVFFQYLCLQHKQADCWRRRPEVYPSGLFVYSVQSPGKIRDWLCFYCWSFRHECADGVGLRWLFIVSFRYGGLSDIAPLSVTVLDVKNSNDRGNILTRRDSYFHLRNVPVLLVLSFTTGCCRMQNPYQ